MSYRIITAGEVLAAHQSGVGHSRSTGYTGEMVDLTDEIHRGDARLDGYTHEESVSMIEGCLAITLALFREHLKFTRLAGLKRILRVCATVLVIGLMANLALSVFMSVM